MVPSHKPSGFSRTPVRLREVQLHVGLIGLDEAQRRRADNAAFSLTEAIRLWLKERSIAAPFHKLLVLVQHDDAGAKSSAGVRVTLGVCQARVSVARTALLTAPDDVRCMLRTLIDALDRVAESADWRSPELETFAHKLYTGRPPYVHVFKGLVKYDPVRKITCSPFVSLEPGRTKIGVYVEGHDGSRRDRILMDKRAPIAFDDDFPLAGANIIGSELVLSDRAGKTLAKVDLNDR